ncbi:diol dehydratase small subunit [soil metagenome]
MTRAFSGRPADELTPDRLARDELGVDDVRIHADTLEHQAQVAENHGNPQLAANFRRAAELASVPEEQVMAMYEALRPHRSSAADLESLARELAANPAPRCAELVREAAEFYARRGLLG